MEHSFGKMIMIAGAVLLGFLLLAFIFSGAFTGGVPSASHFLPAGSVSNPSQNNTGGAISSGNTGTTATNNVGTSGTQTSYKVSISTDNAASETQPATEHISIRNNGTNPVDITGWVLQNGKGKRPVSVVGNTLAYEAPDKVTIPQGIEFLDPDGKSYRGDIILNPGQTAVLITGFPFNHYAFSIPMSFQENKCTGYIATLDKYPFNPTLTKQCPLLKDEEAAKYITQTCYDYVKRISRCDDPEETRPTTFDTLANGCKNFIEKYANYESCVALHGNDEDFYSPKRWRVFLSRSFELWARNNETITLFDKDGNVVATRSY